MGVRRMVATLLASAGVLALPHFGAAAPIQVSKGVGCVSITDAAQRGVDAGGAHVVFTSDCDLTGENAAARAQVFLFDTATKTTKLLIKSAGGCFAVAGPISADGKTIAFASNCDPVGTNADANHEMFVFDTASGVTTQLTKSTGCYAWGVAMSRDGSRVGFYSDCDPSGGNPDHGIEIFVADTATGALTQLTNSSGCSTTVPTLDDTGAHVAFASVCDLTGGNPDHSMEIFLFDASTGTTKQITSGAVPCVSYWPTIDGNGANVAFMSGCNLTGTNPDGSWEIHLYDAVKGAVAQLTDQSNCGTNLPSISADANRIVFESTCNFLGVNPSSDNRILQLDRAAGSMTMLTTTPPACFNGYPATNPGGTDIAFMSTCDYTGGNADHSDEVFLLSAAQPCPPPPTCPAAASCPTPPPALAPPTCAPTPGVRATHTPPRRPTRTPTRRRPIKVDPCGSPGDCAARCNDDPNEERCECECRNDYCRCSGDCIPQHCLP